MAELKFPRKVRSDKEQKELVETAQRLNKTIKDIGMQPTVTARKILMESVKPRITLTDFFKNFLTPPPVPQIPLIPLVKTITIPKSLRYAVEPEVDKIKSKEREEREKETLKLLTKSVEHQLFNYQYNKRNFWYTRIGIIGSITIPALVLVIVLFDIKLVFTEAYLVNGLVGLGVLAILLTSYLAVKVWLNRNNHKEA